MAERVTRSMVKILILAASVAGATNAAAAPASGKSFSWSELSSSDVVTGELTDFLAVWADNDGAGHVPDVMLFVKCEDHHAYLGFSTRSFFASNQANGIRYRIDSQTPDIMPTYPIGDGSMLVTSDPRFIRHLFGAERLYVSITPYREAKISAAFNISGLSQKVAGHFTEACPQIKN